MTASHCEHCPVPGRRCILRERGQCGEAAREASLLARRPHANTPYRKAALAAADDPPAPGIPDTPGLRNAQSEPPLPSLSRQAAGFVATAARVVGKAVTTGQVMADPEEQERRWRLCRSCDHFRSSDRRCGRINGCGCWLEKKIKLLASRCPIGRWEAEAERPDLPAK